MQLVIWIDERFNAHRTRLTDISLDDPQAEKNHRSGQHRQSDSAVAFQQR